MNDRSGTSSGDDDRDLERQGYRPRFLRGLGAFTAFAAGFSYLSILTGIPQNFALGYREAGSTAWWTWPVVFCGQLLVALCFAELAAKFPYCGGIYAWSKRSGSPFLGWLTGWIYLASLIVTIAATAMAMQIVLPSVWGGFQMLERPTANAAVLGAILLAVSTAINVLGSRWLARIMNVGVVIELIAVVALIVLLFSNAVRSPDAVAQVPMSEKMSELPKEFLGIVPLLAAAIMSAYVMYGFDTAGTLAEETVNPRRRAPIAILQALVAAFVLGLLLLMAAISAAPDLNDPRLAADDGGLPFLMKEVLGPNVGTIFVAASCVAIFICTLAVQANAARVMFAMARDSAIPCATWLGVISDRTHVPQRSALVVGLLGIVLLLVNIDFDKLMLALVCVSIVWANLAYLLTNLRSLCTRKRGDWLGWWGVPVHVLASIWTMILITNVAWPRTRFYGEEWYQQYAAVLFTGFLLLLGGLVYAVLPNIERFRGKR